MPTGPPEFAAIVPQIRLPSAAERVERVGHLQRGDAGLETAEDQRRVVGLPGPAVDRVLMPLVEPRSVSTPILCAVAATFSTPTWVPSCE